MSKVVKILSLFYFLLLFKDVFTQNVTEAPAEINDSSQSSWLEWKICKDQTKCSSERYRTCTQTTEPQISCGDLTFKEETKGCVSCEGVAWLPMLDWSACIGSGCADTIIKKEETCSNAIQQPNCHKISSKFCHQNEICNGTWSEWSIESKCSKTCGSGFQRRKRICELNGKTSQDCANTDILEEQQYPSCNTPCQKEAVWGPWSNCKCDDQGLKSQHRNCTLNCEQVKNITQSQDCNDNNITCGEVQKELPTTTTTTTIMTTTTATTTKITSTTSNKALSGKTYLNVTTTLQSHIVNRKNRINDKIIIIVVAVVIILFLIIIILSLVCCRDKFLRKNQQVIMVQPANNNRIRDSYLGEFNIQPRETLNLQTFDPASEKMMPKYKV